LNVICGVELCKENFESLRVINWEMKWCWTPKGCTIAVDGERQIEVYPDQKVSVRLTKGGPVVVDVRRCLQEAARCGILRL